MKNGLCPCHSSKLYAACCEPCHKGAFASSALALMRSRYSAYVLGMVDYILRTEHPQHREAAKPLLERRKEIEQFCKTTLFKGLEIVAVEDGEVKSTVTFRALLCQQGKDFSFTEKSTFEKVDGKWLYLKGEVT